MGALLLAGAELVATNPDALLPTPQGALPETGPLVRYLEYASGKTAAVVGKPNPYIVRLAPGRRGLTAGQVVMVGDTWATDIEAAKAANLWSVLLKTGNGVHPLSSGPPTFHLDGLLELTALL
ncbi:MAG: HAD hydrolase-like protein [Meiothermus sp.]|nr:HAD hydrolase-like protein [Meiothermus sp.]